MLSRWAVSLIFCINGFLHANWVARLPLLQDMYELTHGGLGLVLLCSGIGALIAMPFAGRIIVRFGSHRITQVLLLASVIIQVGIPWMGHMYLLMLLYFCIGLIVGALDVAMNAQAVLVEQKHNKPIMSSFHAIFSAGMVLGAGCGALFSKLGVSLGLHLLIASTICLLGALWAVRHLIEDPHRKKGADSTEKGLIWRPELIILGLVAFCCMLGEGAMADWSTNYLEQVADASRYWAPMGLAAFATAMMVGRFLGDYARIRFGDLRLLLIGASLASLGMTIALIWPTLPTGIFGFFLVGSGLATIVPIAYSTAGSIPGLPPGLGISVVTTIGYAGFLVGPPVIGFIGDWWGLRVGLGLVLLLFVLMFFLNIWGQAFLKRKKGPKSEARSPESEEVQGNVLA